MVERVSRRQFLALGAGAAVLVSAGRIESESPEMESGRGGGALKTIGVLGGIGPQATMDFERRVHAVSLRLIPPRANAGYPPMMVYYCRHAPFLMTSEGRPELPLRPDPRLLEAAKRLGQLADFLVITANGPHLLQSEIERAAGRPVVSMVQATLEEVRGRRWKRAGVLGLGDPFLYTEPLSTMGVACETLGGAERDALDRAVFQLMEGRDDADSAAIARSAVATLRGRDVDGVILGCTEIPLLLGESAEAADLVNPAQLLAEVAVRTALGE